MDRTTFEAELLAQGYAGMVDRHMDANAVKLEHAHEFDAQLLVIEGALTIATEGQQHTCRAGDTFSIAAGCLHAEQAGPEGARYLAGRRYPQAA